MSESKSKSNRKRKPKKRSSCKKEDNNNLNDKNFSNSDSTNQPKHSQNTNSKLCCFSSVDYIVLASTLAIALGEELSDTDIAILSTFFAVLSDELALIGSVNSCSSNNDDAIFVPPVPDVALTTSRKNINKKNIKKKK